MSEGFTRLHRGGGGPPLLLVHGFTGTWRMWELLLSSLERHHDVLAPTLAGHAGGPVLTGAVNDDALADALERVLDEAGIGTAHVVGNSLGGYLAFKLAERGRARSVVALAPAGGWPANDPSRDEVFGYFSELLPQVRAAAPHAEAILSTPEGRRVATQSISVNFEHIPVELLAHQLRGTALCSAAEALIAHGAQGEWTIDAERVRCPVRIVWGTRDALLPWPSAASRYRSEWFPHADWVELDGVGHCPQLDVPLEAAQLILGVTAN